MTIPWYLYAFAASVLWGLHYNIIAKSLTVISPLTAYWVPTTIMMAGLPFFYKTLVADYHAVMASTNDVKAAVVAMSFTSFAASVLLYKAIAGSNATLASLIEISYPIFVVIIAFLFFNENHITPYVLLGGALVMIGTGIVIYGS